MGLEGVAEPGPLGFADGFCDGRPDGLDGRSELLGRSAIMAMASVMSSHRMVTVIRYVSPSAIADSTR